MRQTFYRPLLLGACALGLLVPSLSFAASLSISPSSPTPQVGDTFVEVVSVSSTDQSINAISGEVSFPADLVEVLSVSKENSVLTLWVEDPTFSNSGGTVRFSGVVPNPGYKGSSKRVVSVTFRAKKSGDAILKFISSSALANDGNATDVLTEATSATIHITTSVAVPPKQEIQPSAPTINTSILAAHITSSTHPDQDSWYAKSKVELAWTNDASVSSVRLGYDKKKDGMPTVNYTPPISNKELTLGDGIWYFHVQQKGANGWGATETYRFQIDTKAPMPFTVRFPKGATTTDPRPDVVFNATDELSGIEKYEVSIPGSNMLTVAASQVENEPYRMPRQDPGMGSITVTAYDKAGNSTTSTATYNIERAEVSAFGLLSKLSAFGKTYMPWGLTFVSLLVMLCVLRAHRRHRYTGNAKGEALYRTHLSLRKEFSKLTEEIVEEISALEHVTSKRELTLEEKRIIKHLKKTIEQAEHTIEKEIDSLK